MTWLFLLTSDGNQTQSLAFFSQDGANDPCQQFTGELAEEYCQLAGGHAVSLDSNEKVTLKSHWGQLSSGFA